jgi:hypothetical protein
MRKIFGTMFVVTMAATPALAQQPAPTQAAAPVETPKRSTLTVGTDFTSAYMFRGLFQEDTGAILQPYLDVGVALGRGVSANFGNWESQHSASTGTFYESDYYGSLTATAGKWKPGALFTSYTSPKDRFKTVHELAAVLAYDDSGRAVPFAPKVVLAFELSGQADGGAHNGTYLELGARPTIKLVKARTPLNLAIPLKLGLSAKDYYEGSTGSNHFGYFDVGFIGSVPISVSKGTWEVHGGVDFLTLGDNLKLLNGGDKVKPVASIGFSYVY